MKTDISGTWTPVFEILPGLLYQSGAVCDWKGVDALGIRLAVALYDILDLANGLPASVVIDMRPGVRMTIWWPIRDGSLPDQHALQHLATLATGYIRQGQAVLIHCAGGVNRSGLLTALIVREYLGISGIEALQLVRSRRPGALINETFAEYLTALN